MRHLTTLLFFLVFSSSYGQTSLHGKWYTVSFDIIKVFEYDFSDTILIAKKENWNLKNLLDSQVFKIVKKVTQNKNLYYLMQNLADTNQITLSIISSFKVDISFIEANASEEHTTFKNVEAAMAFIQSDTFQRLGLKFYSEEKLNKLKMLPSPLTISRNNYKTYLNELIKVRKDYEAFSDLHDDDVGLIFFSIYIPNQARVILANLGYNPIINDEDFEKVNDKFKTDKELQHLMNKALKFDDL